MTPEKMVMMANQIAAFFATQKGNDQAQRVADHISDFWEPRMRLQLARHAEAGGAGLVPLAREAAGLMRIPAG
ncbi:formate dehydrogenase subunit delta [Mangrovicoccus algicola]|uniref:Formate dehydrogenase subunit delta n=1 Tax=Mangrovicoccus algicola TaxID=2771008 RepID=A0A8J6YV04_9RHOB|nr:formate dehydrogenase subunit delta [Mangrovicoccus algicola]MBE3636649.1 formate dehydrogenase subunit delta [Mangrovicoccus algicola]